MPRMRDYIGSYRGSGWTLPTIRITATEAEHLYRWHGGNFQNDTFGDPLDPDFPEEF